MEVITDRAPALAYVIDELIPAAFGNTGQYENNRCECDHGRLKARLRPMRGLKTNRTASVVIRGHAFIAEPSPRPLRTQNLRVAGGTPRCRIRRIRPGDLTGKIACSGFRTPVNRLMQQCH